MFFEPTRLLIMALRLGGVLVFLAGMRVCARHRRLASRLLVAEIGFAILAVVGVSVFILPHLRLADGFYDLFLIGTLLLHLIQLTGWGLVVGGLSASLGQCRQRFCEQSLNERQRPAEIDRSPRSDDTAIWDPSREGNGTGPV